MGARGPKAKPVELKVLEGNRGKRPLAVNLDSTFRPEVGMPTVPKGMCPEARKVWKRPARYRATPFSRMFWCNSCAISKSMGAIT